MLLEPLQLARKIFWSWLSKSVDSSFTNSRVLVAIVMFIAKALAKEYGIDQFMRPLLDAPNPKNANNTMTEGEEVVEKSIITEVTIVQTSQKREADVDIEELQDTTDKLDELTVADVKVMKRRIEELEDQANRERKKFRGLAVVAAGLAAASVIPQVLPYFS